MTQPPDEPYRDDRPRDPRDPRDPGPPPGYRRPSGYEPPYPPEPGGDDGGRHYRPGPGPTGGYDRPGYDRPDPQQPGYPPPGYQQPGQQHQPGYGQPPAGPPTRPGYGSQPYRPGGYPPDQPAAPAAQYPPPAAGPPTAHGYPTSGPPGSEYPAAGGGYPPPAGPPGGEPPDDDSYDPYDRPGRGPAGMIAVIAAAGVLVLAIGAVGAWLLLRDTDRDGAVDPVIAIQLFLQAVYRDQDPAAAAAVVCSEARDEAALSAKINDIRTHQQEYPDPRYTWSEPDVVDRGEDRAGVAVTVTMTTGDERISHLDLHLTVLDKGDHGWWVCNLESGGGAPEQPADEPAENGEDGENGEEGESEEQTPEPENSP